MALIVNRFREPDQYRRDEMGGIAKYALWLTADRATDHAAWLPDRRTLNSWDENGKQVPETVTVCIGTPWSKQRKRSGLIYWRSSYPDIRSKIFCNDRWAISEVISALCLLAMMLISQLPDRQCRFNRKNSRTSRLIRFRSTACPTFFVTVTPNRDRLYCACKKYAINSVFCTLRPDFDRAINSGRLRILSAFVKVKRKGQASILSYF